jgi:hypothetical protein
MSPTSPKHIPSPDCPCKPTVLGGPGGQVILHKTEKKT